MSTVLPTRLRYDTVDKSAADCMFKILDLQADAFENNTVDPLHMPLLWTAKYCCAKHILDRNQARGR